MCTDFSCVYIFVFVSINFPAYFYPNSSTPVQIKLYTHYFFALCVSILPYTTITIIQKKKWIVCITNFFPLFSLLFSRLFYWSFHYPVNVPMDVLFPFCESLLLQSSFISTFIQIYPCIFLYLEGTYVFLLWFASSLFFLLFFFLLFLLFRLSTFLVSSFLISIYFLLRSALS